MLAFYLFLAVFFALAYTQFREGIESYMYRCGYGKGYIKEHKSLFYTAIHREKGLGLRYLLNIALFSMTVVYPVLAIILPCLETLCTVLTVISIVFGALFSAVCVLAFRDESLARYNKPWAIFERVPHKYRRKYTSHVTTRLRYRLWDLVEAFMPLLLSLVSLVILYHDR